MSRTSSSFSGSATNARSRPSGDGPRQTRPDPTAPGRPPEVSLSPKNARVAHADVLSSSHRGAGCDTVPQDPDALDLQLDLVARLEPAAVAVLEDAARPDRARAEDVAGDEPRVASRVGD